MGEEHLIKLTLMQADALLLLMSPSTLRENGGIQIGYLDYSAEPQWNWQIGSQSSPGNLYSLLAC